MVQRGTQLGFAAGAIVFPGGKVDQADYNITGSNCAFLKTKPTPLGPSHAGISDEEISVTKLAAIREVFEETGILLATRSGGGILDSSYPEIEAEYWDWRSRIHDDAQQFFAFLNHFELVPDFDALSLFARWRTPPNLHRRYDTFFYLAKMPQGQRECVDGEESVEALWASPNRFIEMGRAGERVVIFPTLCILALLGLDHSYEDIFARSLIRKMDCIEPTVITRGGEDYLSIPNDLGYPITREKLAHMVRG